MREKGLFVCLTILLGPLAGRAAVCTAIDNGNWNTAAIWSCGAVPSSGDLIIIPAGLTVSITSNIIYSGAATRVRVFGTLSFVGAGSKLTLPCGSIVELMAPSGTITGNGSGSSQTLRICGTTYWSAADGPMSGPIVWPPNATLPVELTSYSARSEGRSVALAWSTASEQNSDRFELWRSTDGEVYHVIGSVSAAGNSHNAIDYALWDIPPSGGTWYYKLIQYDLDGTAHYQGVTAVTIRNEQGLHCHPNPASDNLLIHKGASTSPVIVCDQTGRVLLRSTAVSSTQAIDISDWPNGNYVIALEEPSQRPIKLVVAH